MALSQKTKFSIIGILITITLFLLVWGINYLKGKNVFSNENIYIVSYKHVNGLSESSPVLLSGYKVGSVYSIKINFEQMGKIDVEIGIDPKINIPIGTVARIFSTDLMGTKAIELEFSESKQFYQPGDTLVPDTEESLQEQVSIQMLPLKHKAEDLLKEMEEALKIIRLVFNEKSREEIQNSFTYINYSTKNINSITGTLDTLLLSQSGNIGFIIENIRSLTDNLKSSNKDIRQIISNLNQTTDSLSKVSFVNIIKNIDKTLASLNILVDRIEKGEGTVGQMLKNDTLYHSLVDATKNLDKLIEDLNENPKKYLNFRVFDFSKDGKK